MPDLANLIRWHDYAPDIGENRNVSRPFTVQIAVGLSKADLQKLADALDESLESEPGEDVAEEQRQARHEAQADALAKALAPWVRLGKEPLSIAGEAIDTLSKLLRLYTRMAGGGAAALELAMMLRHLNSAGGKTQLFFERLSGGSVASTGPTSRAAR